MMMTGNMPTTTDADLLTAYPNCPYKLLLRWNDARVAVQRAGEAFVAAGSVLDSPEDCALAEAEAIEIALHRLTFGI